MSVLSEVAGLFRESFLNVHDLQPSQNLSVVLPFPTINTEFRTFLNVIFHEKTQNTKLVSGEEKKSKTGYGLPKTEQES